MKLYYFIDRILNANKSFPMNHSKLEVLILYQDEDGFLGLKRGHNAKSVEKRVVELCSLDLKPQKVYIGESVQLAVFLFLKEFGRHGISNSQLSNTKDIAKVKQFLSTLRGDNGDIWLTEYDINLADEMIDEPIIISDDEEELDTKKKRYKRKSRAIYESDDDDVEPPTSKRQKQEEKFRQEMLQVGATAIKLLEMGL